jgi:hypothetical protein
MTGLKAAPKCCLLVFIDDATGRLMHLRFSESETAFDYMLATRNTSSSMEAGIAVQ